MRSRSPVVSAPAYLLGWPPRAWQVELRAARGEAPGSR